MGTVEGVGIFLVHEGKGKGCLDEILSMRSSVFGGVGVGIVTIPPLLVNTIFETVAGRV